MRNFIVALYIIFVASLPGKSLDVLVYSHNPVNTYAVAAANNLSGSVTVADAATFNGLLTGQPWDLVLVDCPSNIPTGGWTDVINFANAGGKIVMSFWDWGNDSGFGDPGLATAFGYTGTTSFTNLYEQTLSAANNIFAEAVFANVPNMPHSDWLDVWFDDGDAFGFMTGMPLAYLDMMVDPVAIKREDGNAIACFIIDEWDGAGAVELWEGLANCLLNPPNTIPTLGEWSLALLTLVLFIIGTAAIKYRKRLTIPL